MHFSSGQITFTIFFLIAFIIGLIWAYGKDKVVNRQHFKGIAFKLIIVIIAFYSLIFLIIKLMR